MNAIMQSDESHVRWCNLGGLENIAYHILENDEKDRTVDILFKFSANRQIVPHRHKADYRTFIIQGELHP